MLWSVKLIIERAKPSLFLINTVFMKFMNAPDRPLFGFASLSVVGAYTATGRDITFTT